jgi:hypothetical protein
MDRSQQAQTGAVNRRNRMERAHKDRDPMFIGIPPGLSRARMWIGRAECPGGRQAISGQFIRVGPDRRSGGSLLGHSPPDGRTSPPYNVSSRAAGKVTLRREKKGNWL